MEHQGDLVPIGNKVLLISPWSLPHPHQDVVVNSRLIIGSQCNDPVIKFDQQCEQHSLTMLSKLMIPLI